MAKRWSKEYGQENEPILYIRCTKDFYTYAAQETSLFILLFWLNWLGNVEVDAFWRLYHFSFDYHVRVSLEKVLIWSTRLPASLHWSLWPDSHCCRIEYHYHHYLHLAVNHNRRHAPCFSLFSHLILYFREDWLKVYISTQFFTYCTFSFMVNRDQKETMEKTLAHIVQWCYSHIQCLEQQQ